MSWIVMDNKKRDTQFLMEHYVNPPRNARCHADWIHPAATGMLEGRRATTHWAYARELELLGARYVRERWVEDGPFITGAGVSAGIDLALVLVAKVAGRQEAARIQLGIEYDPHPPYGGIDWTQVGQGELNRQRQGGTGRKLNDVRRLLANRPDLLEKLGLSAR